MTRSRRRSIHWASRRLRVRSTFRLCHRIAAIRVVAAGREPSVFLIDPAHPKRPPRTFGTGGDMPTALAVAPDGSAWVASEQSDSVLAITPAGMIRAHQASETDATARPASPRPAKPCGSSCSNSRRVVRLRASDGAVVTDLPVDGVPVAMAADGGGSVWVAVAGA